MGLFTCRNDEPPTPKNCEWCGDKAINKERNFCLGTYCERCDKFADGHGGLDFFLVNDIQEARHINGIAWFKRARDQYLIDQEKLQKDYAQRDREEKMKKAKALLKKYK